MEGQAHLSLSNKHQNIKLSDPQKSDYELIVFEIGANYLSRPPAPPVLITTTKQRHYCGRVNAEKTSRDL